MVGRSLRETWGMVGCCRRSTVSEARELLGRPGRRMEELIVREVWTAEGVRRGATYKVGSRKSPGGIGLYKLRSGGTLYPTTGMSYVCSKMRVVDLTTTYVVTLI